HVAKNDIVMGGERREMFGKFGQNEFHGIHGEGLRAFALDHPPTAVICSRPWALEMPRQATDNGQFSACMARFQPFTAMPAGIGMPVQTAQIESIPRRQITVRFEEASIGSACTISIATHNV